MIEVTDKEFKGLYEEFLNGHPKKAAKLIERYLSRFELWKSGEKVPYHEHIKKLIYRNGMVFDESHEHGVFDVDIVVPDKRNDRVVYIKVYSADFGWEARGKALEALNDTSQSNYYFRSVIPFDYIMCYGISVYKKKCEIRYKKVKLRKYKMIENKRTYYRENYNA
jgi:hypothetical protein